VLRSASVFQFDRQQIADRGEDEKAGVALCQLVVARHREPDEEAHIHSGVVPEESAFAPDVGGREALGEHHVDAGHVQAAAGQEQRQPPVQQLDRSGGDAAAPDHLQRHATDEQVPVAQEAAPEVAAEQVQAVVECAEHAHDGRRLARRKVEVTRRVQHQRGLQHRVAQRGEGLDEKERRGALRDPRESVGQGLQGIHQGPGWF
jgi:hypothetical protein